MIRVKAKIPNARVRKLQRTLSLFMHHRYAKLTYNFSSYSFIRKLFVSYLKFRHRLISRYRALPPMLKPVVATLGCFVVIAGSFLAYAQLTKPDYQLTTAESKLIGQADSSLMRHAKFSFDTKSQAYYLDKKDLSTLSNSGTTNAVTVGNSSSSADYSLKLPNNLKRGVLIKDNKSGLAFTLTPQFGTAPVKLMASHAVYPLSQVGGAEAVYTVKENGLQEDLILSKPVNRISLSYKLSLPNYLEARNLSDGGIGVYSANPALFGNITASDSSDQQKLQTARTKGPKDYLVFVLLPPALRDGEPLGVNPKGAKLSLKLEGDIVTLAATQLSHLSYPADIDPSVLVSSATTWGPAGNNESDVTIGSSQISESSLGGGQLGSWTTSSVGLPVATTHATTVVNNGYVYEIGGYTTSTIQTVEYAQLGSSGAFNTQTCPTGWTLSSSTWCYNLSSLPVATDYATSVVYDGYIYEIGGNSGSSVLQTVEYAQVGSNGALVTRSSCETGWTLGGANNTWCYNTSSLNTATEYASSIVYNGYIYEIGGYTGSSILATVEYSQVDDTGGLVAPATCPSGWSVGGANNVWCYKTTSLAVATEAATSVVYDGYVYELSGCETGFTCSTTAQAVAYYAPINANGSLGSWVEDPQTGPTAMWGAATESGGYIYDFGGCTSSGCGTLNTNPLYSQVYTNGDSNYFDQATTLSPAVESGTAVSYNGYVYVIGGENSSSTNQTAIYYSQIKPAGYFGYSQNLANSILTSTENAASVVYDGYIYEIGGYSGAAQLKTVEYSQIQPNGTISMASCPSGWGSSAWCTKSSGTGALAVTDQYSTAVATNDTIYLIAGQMNGTSATNTVYISTPSNTTGAPGAWTTSASYNLNTATEFASSVTYDGYVYEIGGYSGSSSLSTVEFALSPIAGGAFSSLSGLCPSGWSLSSSGDWCYITSSLFTATQYASSVVNGGYIYEIGGCTSSCGNTTGSGSETVEYSQVNAANGNLSTPTCPSGWTASSPWCYNTSSLPANVAWATAQVNNGYVYDLGGGTSQTVENATVEYAPLNNDGSVGSWAANVSLSQSLDQATSGVDNGYIYVIGGYNGSATTNLNAYQPANGGNASIVSLADAGNDLPAATSNSSSVAYDGYLYEVGGLNSSANPIGTVDEATINNNGTVGTWSDVGDLPTPAYLTGLVAVNGYIYDIGGYTLASNAGAQSMISYAQINTSNGTLTAPSCASGYTLGTGGIWCIDSSAFPVNIAAAPVVSYDNYLYSIGGHVGGASTNVYYAPLNTNGSIGSWTTGSSLLASTQQDSAAEYNGYIYEMGGNSGGHALASVQYAPINANGSVGTWLYGTSLPNATQQNEASEVAYNGNLYLIGGADGINGDFFEEVNINSNGTLGNWVTDPTVLTQNTKYDSTAFYNGYLYILGGNNNGATTYYTTVDYTAVQSIPRIGYFSMPISLDSVNVTPASLVTNGTNTGNLGYGTYGGPGLGGLSVTYENATTSCNTYNSPTLINTLFGSQMNVANKLVMSSNGCGTSTNLSDIVWLRFTLDDTTTVTFPDSAGNHTTISSYTIFYHPNIGYRLRGGATFNGGSLQSLDAPPLVTQ
jgi:hypothetical protein